MYNEINVVVGRIQSLNVYAPAWTAYRYDTTGIYEVQALRFFGAVLYFDVQQDGKLVYRVAPSIAVDVVLLK